jgi:PAS domain S-box-containing protein
MLLLNLFQSNPLASLALCLCLGSSFWATVLIQRRRQGPDRLLLGLIGLVCISQGLQLLRGAGILQLSRYDYLSDIASLMTAILYLISTVLLHHYGDDYRRTKMHLRLAEANERCPTPFLRSAQAALPQPVLSPDHGTAEILEAIPLPTYLIDPGGVIRYWNRTAEQHLGRRREEVLGRTGDSVHSLYPGECAMWRTPILSAEGQEGWSLVLVMDRHGRGSRSAKAQHVAEIRRSTALGQTASAVAS